MGISGKENTGLKPATLHEVKTTYIVCPDCGYDTGFTISHLFNESYYPYEWGPWGCDKCGIHIRGRVLETREVEIKITDDLRNRKGLMLVQITYDGFEEEGKEPIYLVFGQTIYSHNLTKDGELEPDVNEYWVNEHTCPTNIWRALRILVGEDTDCHGILKHVQTVFSPEGFDLDKCHMLTYEDWTEIFDRLPGRIIEGSVSHPTIFLQTAKLLTKE